MSERIRKGVLSSRPKFTTTKKAWVYEERGGLSVWYEGFRGIIPLRTIKAYLKRREAMK